MSPTEQQKTDPKQSLSMGCITVLVSFAIVVVGVVVAVIFKPDTAMNQIEVNGGKTQYSMVETLTPKTFNSVVEQSEELRIDLTLEEDTKYGSRVKSGALKVTGKDQSTVMSVSISVAIFFLILGIILAGVIFTKWLFTSVIKQKRAEREVC